MADEIFQANFDDSEIVKKLDDLEKQIVQIGKSVDTVGDTAAASLNQAADAAGNFTAEMDTAATQTAKQAKAVDSARAANKSWLASIRETIAGQQIGGKTLGEWGEQARAFADRINLGAKATSGLTGVWRIFNGVLKASGIGLLIGLVASVIAYFTRFQSGVDKVSRVMAGLNGVVNELIDRFLKLGTAILKVFTGDFAGAAADVTAAVTGIGDALVSAAVDAYNLEKAFQALRDTVLRNSVTNAQQERDLARLKTLTDDTTISISQRMKATQEAGKIEREIAQRNREAAEERLRLTQRDLDANEDNAAKIQAAQEAQIEFLKADAELITVVAGTERELRELRKESAQERQKQLDEERKRAEQLRKEYEKLFADVQRQAESLNIENTFNPVERVIKQYQAALDETNALRARLLVLAPTDAEKAKVNEAIETLFDEIAIKYREELNKAEDELNELRGGKIREALNPLPPLETLQRDVTDVLKSLSQAADDFIEGRQPRSLAEILGLTPDAVEGLKDAARQIVDVLGEMADARVREADAAVDAAERRVTAAQEALDRELEIAEQGFANDVNLKKRELEEAKKLQEEAEKERAKAVKTQILLDSVNQISSLVTASANIFKSLSSIPFVGIPLAIAAIATMFGAFAKAKADALKAASVPKFRKGTKLEGRSHEGGGMAISDEYGQVVGEAEGGEWLIGTKPSREHDTFLRRLNRGEFSGVDLNGLIPRPAAANPLTESAGRIGEVERQRREIETGQHYAAMVAAYEKSAGRIVEAIQAKEVVFPLPNGYKVKTRKGRQTVTETVKFEQ